MKIKTKLWALTAFTALMLIAMVSVVYLKGRSTMMDLTNLEGKDTAVRTAAIADAYLDGIGNILNNLVPISNGYFNANNDLDVQRLRPALAKLLKANQGAGVLDIYVGESLKGALATGSGFIPDSGYDPRTRPWFQQGSASSEIAFTEPYIDASTGKMILSVVKAIKSNDGNLLGVAGIDLSLEQLHDIVLNARVFGEGFGTLLDRSGLIVVHPDNNLVMKENITRASAAIPEGMAHAGQQMIQRNVGFADYTSATGIARRTFFAPIQNGGYTLLIVFPKKEINNILMNITLPQMIGGALTTLLIMIAMFFTIPSIVKPIGGVAQTLKRLAELDLTTDSSLSWLDTHSNGQTEIGEMIASLSQLRSKIKQTMEQLRHSVTSTAATATRLEELTQRSNAEAQASKVAVEAVVSLASTSLGAINSANRFVDEVSHAANMTANSATEGAEASSTTASLSQSAVSSVRQFIDKLGTVEKASCDNNQSITEVGSSVTAISEFVNTIRNIASQTNLLALNAAIEAARAGEAGRGFAVVADEVRKLAEESNVASHQVAELIEKLQNNTESSISATRQSTQVIGGILVNADDAQSQLQNALEAIDRINDSMQTIAAAAEEQAASSSEIARSINQVTESTQELTEKISQVDLATENSVKVVFSISREAEALAAVTDELRQVMDQFTLNESEKSSPRWLN